MLIYSASDMKSLLHDYGIEAFFHRTYQQMLCDYQRWSVFHKRPRVADYFDDGVIELMPISDEQHYAVKYITCYPKNTHKNLFSVYGLGILADTKTGLPLMFCDMTLLTAIRTAITSALVAKLVVNKPSINLGIIGLGAQSGFHLFAIAQHFKLNTIKIYDIDDHAMERFNTMAQLLGVATQRCEHIDELIDDTDVIATLTASKGHQNLLPTDGLKSDVFIAAVGGDAPGKTELSPSLIAKSHIIVSHLDQTKVEGEIQQDSDLPLSNRLTALWQLVQDPTIIDKRQYHRVIFDSVGFAIEDFSVLMAVYRLKSHTHVDDNFFPQVKDTRALFSWFMSYVLDIEA